MSIWQVVIVWPDWGWWCQCPGVLWCLQMSLVWLWGHFTASQPPALTLVTANDGWCFGWTLVWDKNKYLNKWINSRYLELCLPGSWGVTEYHYQLQMFICTIKADNEYFEWYIIILFVNYYFGPSIWMLQSVFSTLTNSFSLLNAPHLSSESPVTKVRK